MKRNTRKCPKHLVGTMPYSEPEQTKWVRKWFNGMSKADQAHWRRRAKQCRRRFKGSKCTPYSALRAGLLHGYPGIEAIDPRQAVFKSLGTVAHFYQGTEWKESVGFKGSKLVWTDGVTMRPVALKWAMAWFAKMKRRYATAPDDKEIGYDNDLLPQARFMAMVAKAL